MKTLDKERWNTAFYMFPLQNWETLVLSRSVSFPFFNIPWIWLWLHSSIYPSHGIILTSQCIRGQGPWSICCRKDRSSRLRTIVSCIMATKKTFKYNFPWDAQWPVLKKKNSLNLYQYRNNPCIFNTISDISNPPIFQKIM